VDKVIKTKNQRTLREEFDNLTATFPKSFLMKNPAVITLNAQLLFDELPKALFIVIERDTLEVANSIVESRKNYHSSVNDWFSGIPKACRNPKRLGNAYDQVANQVYHYEQNLNNFLEKTAKDKRVMTMTYLEMVTDLKKQMARVSRFLKSHGVSENKFLEKLPLDKVTHREQKITYKKELEKAFGKINCA